MNSAGRAYAIACIVASSLALSFAAGCTRAPPEQQLRETIAALQGSIETRDAGALGEAMADDFIGPDGLDRDGARRMAQLMLMRHREVAASLGPLRVELDGRHARVRFTAVLTGGPGGLLPESGQV